MRIQPRSGSRAFRVGKRSLAGISCLTILLLLASSRAASASHFEGGRLSWVQDTSYLVPGYVKVTVTFEGAFRWSFTWPSPTPADPPVGTIIGNEVFLQLTGTSFSEGEYVPLLVTTVSPTEDLLTGIGSIEVIIPNSALPVTVSLANCCRASTLAEANHDQSYFLTTVIDTSQATRSPVTTALPRVYLEQNASATFPLPSTAFDGLTNVFSFVLPSTSGLVTPRPNGTPSCSGGCSGDWPDNLPPIDSQSMQLSPLGNIQWTPQSAGIYATQFSITSVDQSDNSRARVPLDMEFVVVGPLSPADCPSPGPCAPPTFSPTTPPSLVAPTGQLASFTVSASTSHPGDNVTLDAFALPGGASFVQTDASPTTTGHGLFSWTPTAADLGAHYACLQATESLTGSVNYGMYCASIQVVPPFCSPGSYSATGSIPCTLAPAGSYVSATGATSATLCPAGTFSGSAGAIACTAAPAGSYASGTGNTSATLCPAGTYTNFTGASACISAPAGSYAAGAGNTSAALCPAGTYSSTAGAIACTSAPAGSYVGVMGATSATLCPAGTYSSSTGAIACTPAPAGSYVAVSGATSATLCPAGTYSSATGAIVCTAAPAGSYAAGTGHTSATPCPAGTYTNFTGASACISAPAGSYASGTGNTSATPCPAGTFSSVAGSSSCTLAPAGSYASGTGNTSATPCPAGMFSSVAGASSCTLAPAGSYDSGTGNTSATPCPAGTFSSVAGASSCTLAPAGSYDSGTGNTSAAPCPAGTFSSVAGASSCTLAPAGSYDSGTGNTSATPCPAGTWSSPGASACTSVALLLSQAIDAYLSGYPGLANSLHQKAEGIASAPTAQAKAGKLQAFINEVNALRGNPLTDAQADNLIFLAGLL